MDEKFETACFQIITYVGTARTHFINAIQCAKEGKYDEAAELIKQGDEAFSLGHNAHADLLTMDAILLYLMSINSLLKKSMWRKAICSFPY